MNIGCSCKFQELSILTKSLVGFNIIEHLESFVWNLESFVWNLKSTSTKNKFLITFQNSKLKASK